MTDNTFETIIRLPTITPITRHYSEYISGICKHLDWRMGTNIFLTSLNISPPYTVM